jgi:hypothetical protein
VRERENKQEDKKREENEGRREKGKMGRGWERRKEGRKEVITATMMIK